MAIHDNEQERSSTIEAEPPRQPNDRRRYDETAKRTDHSTDYRGFTTGVTLHRGLVRGLPNDTLNDYKKTIDHILETKNNEGLEFRVVPVNHSLYSMHYSLLLVVAKVPVREGPRILVSHALIMEGSNTRPQNTRTVYGNDQFELPTTASFQWDARVAEQCRTILMKDVGDMSTRIVGAGASVVPREIQPTDDQMMGIVVAAYEAIYGTIETEFPEVHGHVNLADLLANNPEAIAQFVYNNDIRSDMQVYHSVNGLPIRNDIHIYLGFQNRVADFQGVQSVLHNQSTQLIQVSAYTDLLYLGPQRPDPRDRYQEVPTQIFSPEVVITSIAPLGQIFTPELFLLGLAMTTHLYDDYGWSGALGKANDNPMRDLAGIGCRLDRVEVDTQSKDFNEDARRSFIAEFIKAQPDFSLDVDDTGPESWLTRAFVEAADGDSGAIRYLVTAANNLTNGRFAQYFDPHKMDIVAKDTTRIFLGTYIDDQRIVRDLRDIDSLAILNFYGSKDPDRIDAWESTFNPQRNDIDYYLSTRLDILNEVTNRNQEIRGYATRVILDNRFLGALANAVADGNFMIKREGLASIFHRNVSGAYRSVQNYEMDGNAVGRMVQRGSVRGPTRNMRRTTGYTY